MSSRQSSRQSARASPHLAALGSHTVYGKSPRQPSQAKSRTLSRSGSQATSTYSTRKKRGLRPTVVQRIDITLKRDKLGRLGFKMDPDSLIVHDVYDSLLTNAGVTPGATLVTVDGKRVRNMKDYTEICGDNSVI